MGVWSDSLRHRIVFSPHFFVSTHSVPVLRFRRIWSCRIWIHRVRFRRMVFHHSSFRRIGFSRFYFFAASGRAACGLAPFGFPVDGVAAFGSRRTCFAANVFVACVLSAYVSRRVWFRGFRFRRVWFHRVKFRRMQLRHTLFCLMWFRRILGFALYRLPHCVRMLVQHSHGPTHGRHNTPRKKMTTRPLAIIPAKDTVRIPQSMDKKDRCLLRVVSRKACLVFGEP